MMSILLLAAILASLGAAANALDCWFAGQIPRARRLVLRWTIGAGVQALIAVPLFSPANPKTRGPHCDDDWCMSVESVSRTPAPSGVFYRL